MLKNEGGPAFTFSETDGQVLNIFNSMLDRYNTTITTTGGLTFNQNNIITMITAYLMSKYVNTQAKGTHFFNEMRKVKDTFERKTHIKWKEIQAEINEKALNFLLKAAKVEFGDDYNMENYQIDYTDSMSKFGTAVTKTVHRKGNDIASITPFETFLCDPVDGENLPAGEVTASTLQMVIEDPKYDEKVINRVEHFEMQRIGDADYQPYKTAVRLYEIHGQLPKSIFGLDGKGTTNGMFIIMETEELQRYVLFTGRTSNTVYKIDKINKMFGRTMGYGPMEAMLESQMMTNKLGNMNMEHLVAASKIFYQTADTELDGQDLQEIDNLVLINHESDEPITQVSASPQAYSAMSNFMDTVVSMGRESAAIQDASLGRGPKSNTSFAAIQANAKEADGVYSSIRDKIFNLQRLNFKKKGGFLDMIIDYIESGKDVEKLLTPFEQRGFRKFVARGKANIEVQRQQDEDFIFIDGLDDVAEFMFKKDSDITYKIEFEKGEIDRSFIIDKSRLTYTENDSIIVNKLAALERTLDIVSANPQAYPGFNPNDLLMEIMELTDIAAATNITVKPSQSGQISATPTGPEVAVDNGLV